VRILRGWLLIVAAIAMAASLAAQVVGPAKADKGHITGTVTDANGDTLSGASVALGGAAPASPRTAVSNDAGFFEFDDLDPGTYNISISAKGFANWTSPDVIVKPGQYVILPGSKLRITATSTTVSVVYSQEEIATQQVKIEEQQRVLGIFPNYYVVYDKNPVPLTTKLKFHLAYKTYVDPINFAAIGVLAGINQAADVPDYRQGAKGYAERYGAAAADGLSDIMIGGAILPSLLHQDPRYYYQGTGTNKSRALHALAAPFVCKGDSGHLQPNYSSVGGDLASAALSNAYYPASNRGAGLVFENLAINTAERMVSTLVQEFILQKFTPKARNKN
jgi:hypothetical protein